MEKKIRILHLVTRWVSGGAAKVVLLLAKELVRRGHEVEIACGEEEADPYLMEEGRRSSIPFHFIPGLVRDPRGFEDFQALFYLASFLRRRAYHVVHTHTSKAGVIGRWANQGSGRPSRVVHTPHGHIFEAEGFIPGVHQHRWLRRGFYGLERLSSLCTDYMTTLTEKERQDLIALDLARPRWIQTVYNSIENVSPVSPEAVERLRRELGLPKDRKVLSVIGRLSREKGQEVALECLYQFKKRGLSAEAGPVASTPFLLVIGEGPEEDTLRNTACTLGLEQEVKFLGRRFDVPTLIALSDVILVPSHYEGFSLVILEAFSQKKPVVASRVGGIPEVIRHGITGLLFPRGEAQPMRAHLLWLWGHPEEAKEMTRRAYEDFLSRFSLPHMIDSYERIYAEVLRMRRLHHRLRWIF